MKVKRDQIDQEWNVDAKETEEGIRQLSSGNVQELLGKGMKEDEVQELTERNDDGWEYVDEP
ncbi:hypothetical protein [Jeotgalibacillus soli]|uniref:Uncharacterized protein n=1 Tax=Jeotgalibacillus soli TaxID=889306 RepID=A0A0C2RUC1_9BACL|nr:hypothetical protein [Jeotgalibacillus soli]KIL45344.1 hypothetical protein KP78_28880 [Jeotgalibacillus soli]